MRTHRHSAEAHGPSSGSPHSVAGREDGADIDELASPQPPLGFLLPGQGTQAFTLGSSESSVSLPFWGVVDIFIDFRHCTWKSRDMPGTLLGSRHVRHAPWYSSNSIPSWH